MGFGTVNVTTSATKIVGANAQRQSLILTNASTSGIVYLGPDATITSTNAAVILDGFGNLSEDSGGTRMFMGDVYGITGSSTADILYWERTR